MSQDSQEQRDQGARRRVGPPRLGALRIGRIVGVPVYVNLSWFVVALLIAWYLSPSLQERVPELGRWSYVAGLVFAILLYGSVLVHEISHVLVAKRFGLPVRAITVQFLGGVSEIEREPETPWREFAVAVVGPLTSLGLGLGAGAATLAFEMPALLELAGELLAGANLLVGVFNLLPGLPLDGGRMLRAGVWVVTKRPHVGSQVAGWAGRGVAVLVILLPWVLLAGNDGTPNLVTIIWSILIATFLWAGSTQALVTAKIRRKLPALKARELARRGLPVPSDLPLSEAIRRAELSDAGAIVVVDNDGRPTALVNEAAVVATPEQRRPWILVGDVARRLETGLVLSAELRGEDLVRAMGGTPATEYLLVEPDGSIYGVLSSRDVDGAFSRA
ncbi:site-2 protease family protein [Flindersiella endophytica]